MNNAKFVGHLNREGMKALSEGDLMNARFLLYQALDKCRLFKSPLNEAKIRNNLGLVLQQDGDLNSASENFQAALKIVRDEVGEETGIFKRIETNYRRCGCAA
jgi:tetratricopeptide (TPR) repeat protein